MKNGFNVSLPFPVCSGRLTGEEILIFQMSSETRSLMDDTS